MARVLWAGGVGRAGGRAGEGQVPELGEGWGQTGITGITKLLCGAGPAPFLGRDAARREHPGRWALLPPDLFILGETEEYFISLTKQHFTSG